MKRLFPRAKQKAIIKKYESKARMAKNVDALIFLDYMLFLKRLAAEANTKAQETKERTLEAYHVTSIIQDVLKSCKG